MLSQSWVAMLYWQAHMNEPLFSMCFLLISTIAHLVFHSFPLIFSLALLLHFFSRLLFCYVERCPLVFLDEKSSGKCQSPWSWCCFSRVTNDEQKVNSSRCQSDGVDHSDSWWWNFARVGTIRDMHGLVRKLFTRGRLIKELAWPDFRSLSILQFSNSPWTLWTTEHVPTYKVLYVLCMLAMIVLKKC